MLRNKNNCGSFHEHQYTLLPTCRKDNCALRSIFCVRVSLSLSTFPISRQVFSSRPTFPFLSMCSFPALSSRSLTVGPPKGSSENASKPAVMDEPCCCGGTCCSATPLLPKLPSPIKNGLKSDPPPVLGPGCCDEGCCWWCCCCGCRPCGDSITVQSRGAHFCTAQNIPQYTHVYICVCAVTHFP